MMQHANDMFNYSSYISSSKLCPLLLWMLTPCFLLLQFACIFYKFYVSFLVSFFFLKKDQVLSICTASKMYSSVFHKMISRNFRETVDIVFLSFPVKC